MNGRMILSVLGTVSMVGLIAALPVAAETRAFEKLSRSNQIIAQALFVAQRTDRMQPGVAPLTLDDLAALRLQGREWAIILQDMEFRGLIHERQLGRVVSRFFHRRRSPFPPSTTSAPGNDDRVIIGDEARQERPVSPREVSPWDDSQSDMSGLRDR